MFPTRAISFCTMLFVAGARQASPGIERARWLAGCWETTQGESIIRENWAPPVNGVMLENGSVTRQGSIVESETIRLFQRGKDLIYDAHPSGQPSAEFRSTRIDDSTAVFTNPTHDFPRTIAYRLRGDSLFARVEGAGRGNAAVRIIDFNYQRMPCAKR